MKNNIGLAIAAVAIVGVAYFWISMGDSPVVGGRDASSAAGTAIVNVVVPDKLSGRAEIGKKAFEVKCAVCHGANAGGKDGVAPPLVHKIYEPSHHGDAAFLVAAKNGVRAHHWRFGNMPPVEGVTDGDVKMIVAYVRELQRANGIN